MTYTTLDNLTQNGSSSDLIGILNLPNMAFGWAWNLVLFAIFAIITLRLFFKDYELKGRSDFISSLVPASFITVLLAVILKAMTLISSASLIIWVVIFAVIVAILVLTNSKD